MRTSTRQPSSVTDRRDTPFFNGLLDARTIPTPLSASPPSKTVETIKTAHGG